MRSSYKYRLLGKATWGIAIDLTAEYDSPSPLPNDAATIADDLWFVCDQKGLTDKEAFFLRLGLRSVSDEIVNARKPIGATLVRVVAINYNPTDYQSEGLAAAIAQWAAKAFQFELPPITAEYDKVCRRVCFSFESVADPAVEDNIPTVDIHRASAELLQNLRQMLEDGQFASAAAGAGSAMRIALRDIVRVKAGEYLPESARKHVTIDDLLAVLTRSGRVKPPSVRVKRHIARIGAWYPDVKIRVQRPNRHEAEALVNSAEAVVTWVNEETAYGAVK